MIFSQVYVYLTQFLTLLLTKMFKFFSFTTHKVSEEIEVPCSTDQDVKMEEPIRPELNFISNMPLNIIDNILGRLTLRQVVRTSILSRDWRYKWLTCPKLKFNMWYDRTFLRGHKLEKIIYQILQLHQGPLLKFVIQVPDLKSNPNIDQWVHMLPDTLQHLALHVSIGDKHKLTSRVCNLRNLRKLRLYNIAFDHPPGFMGFPKLVYLDLHNSGLVPENFGKFIALCPLVEKLRMIHCTEFDCLEIIGPKLKFFEFHGIFKTVSFKNCPVLTDLRLTFSSPAFKAENGFSFDLVKSLSCLPALDELQLRAYALEDLVEYGAPNKLPIALKTLKYLHLTNMFFEKTAETSCAICFIRSCTNLQRLKITAFTFEVVDSVADFLRAQTPTRSLTQLKAVKMQLFCGIESEMEFVRYILASATVLEKMAITTHPGTIDDGGESIVNELKQYPRASPKVEIISSDQKHDTFMV